MTPDGDPQLFWATAGGMGLTGLITRATIRLKRVESSLVTVDTVKTADIDETMAVLAEHDKKYGYTVAWSDVLATGARPRPVDHHQRRLRRGSADLPPASGRTRSRSTRGPGSARPPASRPG